MELVEPVFLHIKNAIKRNSAPYLDALLLFDLYVKNLLL